MRNFWENRHSHLYQLLSLFVFHFYVVLLQEIFYVPSSATTLPLNNETVDFINEFLPLKKFHSEINVRHTSVLICFLCERHSEVICSLQKDSGHSYSL